MAGNGWCMVRVVTLHYKQRFLRSTIIIIITHLKYVYSFKIFLISYEMRKGNERKRAENQCDGE